MASTFFPFTKSNSVCFLHSFLITVANKICKAPQWTLKFWNRPLIYRSNSCQVCGSFFYMQNSLADLPLKNFYRFVIPTKVFCSHFHSKTEIGSFFHLCSVDLLANTCDDACKHLSHGSCMLLQLQMHVVLKRFVELVQIMILRSFDFCTGCVHSRGCPYTRTLRTVFQYATFSHSDYEPRCSRTLACWVRCCSVSFFCFSRWNQYILIIWKSINVLLMSTTLNTL